MNLFRSQRFTSMNNMDGIVHEPRSFFGGTPVWPDFELHVYDAEWLVYNGKCLWYMVFKRSQHRFDTFGRILYINAWSERRKASLIHHPSSSKAYMLPPETTESKAFVEYIFNVIHTGVPTRIAFSPALCCDVMVPPVSPENATRN